jgi:hypothetical protein
MKSTRLLAFLAPVAICSAAGLSEARTISFSGIPWTVKESGGEAWGPGPNVFSSDPETVFVDAAGRLHLRITQKDGVFRCAEVIAQRSFGYGTYLFSLDSPIANLDPSVVLGLFTWSDDEAEAHREIDIELSRWGGDTATNAQYAVQPYETPGHLHRFSMLSGAFPTVHGFTWRPTSVAFLSAAGNVILQRPSYTGGGVPRPGGESPRINLWLYEGKAPLLGQPVEVIVSRFQFLP